MSNGFDVATYGNDNVRMDEKYSTIKEIVDDQREYRPGVNVNVSFTGNMMRLIYHSYEHLLPTRMREVEENANMILDKTIKKIKKDYKEKLKKTLNLKEKKELANYSVNKVSLNERYMYSCWRFYEL